MSLPMNQMSDLELARQTLKKDKLSLVIAKDTHVLYQTKTEGIQGLIRAIGELGDELSATSVADRVMGKAAALLCVYIEALNVFGLTASKSGLATLKKQGIHCEFEKLVPMILNVDKSCKCPLEKMVENLDDAEEAYEQIKQFVQP